MQTAVIQIGNSKGVRLTKAMLLLSGIKKDVDVRVKKGEIKITPIKDSKLTDDFAVVSEASFAKDWSRPEEEKAWEAYQSGK